MTKIGISILKGFFFGVTLIVVQLVFSLEIPFIHTLAVAFSWVVGDFIGSLFDASP